MPAYIRHGRERRLHKILSFENDPSFQLAREKLLQQAGYSVVSASSGDELLALLRADVFALIILDYYMPGTDGHIVIRRVRERNAFIPIILVSGYRDFPGAILRLIDAVIVKDGGAAVLLDAIAKQLSRLDNITG